MALTPGIRLGVYKVTAQIGEGGMGEVYRARDTKLDRDVAIKILSDAFAADADRVARFQREAKTLASLNHPNIAHIHGLEESNGVRALVMELVEGEDLSQRIARGAIPLAEAWPIAKQIAEALEAAHEQGIIHRDLKPANIKITPDGAVKVLDFGLAKLAYPEATAGHADVTASPTLTSPATMTGAGVILGTAAYMSPEQAKGRAADKRSDVWAFGCVMFEMLTGARAFDGDDMTDVLGAVVRLDPAWSRLPAGTPPAVRALLESCLAKDRRQRIGDIAAALFVLKAPTLGTSSGTATGARVVARPPLWRRLVTHTGTLVVGGVLTGAIVWLATRPTTSSPRVSRLQIMPPSAAALVINGLDRDLTITPDGSRIVYIGGSGGTTLFVRALEQLDATPLARVGGPRSLFVSPDGQWVGFIDGTSVLKKVSVTGGPAETMGQLDGVSRGATWSPDGTIIVATSNATTGLLRIGAAGEATVLTRPDRARGEADHLWPRILPGGQAVLFTITATKGGLDAASVVVLDLRTGTQTTLIRGGTDAQYVASGHLVYGTGGTLRAVAFDLARLAVVGPTVPVLPQVLTGQYGSVDAAVTDAGTLVYVSGMSNTHRTLVWVDRQGQETPIVAPPRAYIYPRVSPDGTRIAVGSADEDADIWLWDVVRATLTPVTFDPGVDTYPVWRPDGRRLFFASERQAGARNLFGQAADGTGAVERLIESPNSLSSTAISPDGTRLVFTDLTTTGEDVMALQLEGAHKAMPLVQTPSTERNGIISPNGRWLAYEANDSGQLEVYVRPFPEVTTRPWKVSTAGGTRPLWARNGQELELFYLAPDDALMRVGVERGPTWAASAPTKLLDGRSFFRGGGFLGRNYDVSPDGKRFLMMKPGSGAESTSAPTSLVVVQHFDEELKRLVPTK